MRPAASIVIFTTAAGAGYGLLILAALLAIAGALPSGGIFGALAVGLALLLVTIGLVASTFHLKHPERAWRAVTQWRSSWLSREGVAALATYPPAVALGGAWFLGMQGTGWFVAAGVLAAAGAAVTLFCTAMIYASLRPVRQWHTAWTPITYFALALASGGVLLALLLQILGEGPPWADGLALVLLAVAWGTVAGYWRAADASGEAPPPPGLLGPLGSALRLLDHPHTEENYVMREMGFRVARKHGAKLRRIAAGLGFALPAVLLVTSLTLPKGYVSTIALALTAVSLGIGLLVQRWLFFAQARHTSAAYYPAA